MRYVRMPIEIEAPEEMGYGNIACNLTESSVHDLRFGDLPIQLDDMLVCYTDHRGDKQLRQWLTQEANASLNAQYQRTGMRGLVAGGHPTPPENLSGPIHVDQILVTPGAAAALFSIATALLQPGDHILVEKPNYATNIETPRALDIDIDFLQVSFDENYTFPFQTLREKIRPNTRYVSITNPHNPTGTVLSPEQLQEIVDFTAEKGVVLIVDETYRDLSFETPAPIAATLAPHVVSISSMSKAWGLPGIRLGWLICQDAALYEQFFAAKEQILICNSIVDETIAQQVSSHYNDILTPIAKHALAGFETVKQWIASEVLIEWVEPSGGVVCFPKIVSDQGIDIDLFYKILNEEYKTFVGPGHWFEEDRHHMRIGYGWPSSSELTQGLENISVALRKAQI